MAPRTHEVIVVLDTSVLVSAALFKQSTPERALLRAIEPPHRLVTSDEVEREYLEVLFRPKFDRYATVARRQKMLGVVLNAAKRVEVVEQIRECADPNDDKYLALALAGKADAIVTGDQRHLLPLHPWRGVAIVTPATFLVMAGATA